MRPTSLPLQAFAVPLPAQYERVMGIFELLNFNWVTVVVPHQCLGGFAQRLIAAALSPLVELAIVVGCVMLISVAAAKMDGAHECVFDLWKRAAYRTVPLILFVLSALLVPVSARIFSTFSCVTFGEDDERGTTRAFLIADLGVECSGEKYVQLQALAGALIALWPVGVCALFSALLFASQSARPWAAPLSRTISFLHGEYTERCFYWGLLELGRTLFLTGFVFLIPFEWSTLRLVLALLVSVGHLVTLLSAQPHKQPSTALVAVVTSLSLLCTLLAALLVRLFDEIETRSALLMSSLMNDRIYSAESAFVLTIIILFVNLSVLGVAGGFIAFEARRLTVLRLQATGHTPALTLAAGKRWHLFLSHKLVPWRDRTSTLSPTITALPHHSLFDCCPSHRA